MPRLLYSTTSPYSAKVRMAAAWLELPIEAVTVNTSEEPTDLIGNNPLGKIPTLVLDDGSALFDSRVIMQELDRMSGHKLYPRNAKKRIEAQFLEAIGDGIGDICDGVPQIRGGAAEALSCDAGLGVASGSAFLLAFGLAGQRCSNRQRK